MAAAACNSTAPPQPCRAHPPVRISPAAIPQWMSVRLLGASSISSWSSRRGAAAGVSSRFRLRAVGGQTEQAAEVPQLHQQQQQLTCRRCFQRFSSAANSVQACRFHPAMFTGGEVAKAIGFVRQSSAPEHQLGAVVGRTGLMRFWDCCGAADEGTPGCESGFHLSFDDTLNSAAGWRE